MDKIRRGRKRREQQLLFLEPSPSGHLGDARAHGGSPLEAYGPRASRGPGGQLTFPKWAGLRQAPPKLADI